MVADNVLKHADVYQVDRSLEELWANANNSASTLERLRVVCDTELQKHPIIARTTRHVDRNGKDLSFYLGYRVASVSF